MSQPPSTPVKVPSSAASYTPATLDADLRSQINTVLLRDGHINKIQDSLLHALNSHQTDWPTAVQNHALALLRSGEIASYTDLLRRVLEDVRNDSAGQAATASSTANGDSGGVKVNGNGTSSSGSSDKISLAIPDSVIEEALKVTRASLEAVCDVVEDTNSA